jgi:ATP-dependent Lon protease
MIIPLFVGRSKSIRALEKALAGEQKILLVAQKLYDDEHPTVENIYSVGTVATLLQMLKLPDGTVKILAEGEQRCQIQNFNEAEDYISADVTLVDEVPVSVKDAQALCRAVISQFEVYVKLNPKISVEILSSIIDIEDASRLADAIATHLILKLADQQALLSTFLVAERLEKLLGYLENEIDLLQIEQRLRTRVKQQMDKSQRDYYLNEQLKAIQKELADTEGEGLTELEKLKAKIKQADMPKEAFEKG